MISKAEQASSKGGTDAPEGDEYVADEEVSIPILKGPYPFQDLNAMESMNILDEVHYVYLLRKGEN